MAIKRSRGYKDITLDFKPNPVTGDLNVLKNERSITRAVRNLVQTGVNERFYSSVGSDITETLFGFVDVASGGIIAAEIKSLLLRYEPRIANIAVKADPRPDSNAFELFVSYHIVGQDYATQSFSFILEATR
tara:strand:+ start:409 stop:804 length:396 start_codon:yes stop_codon:yes gene_type:complete